ncbi:Gamma-glutamylcyclotransferase [Pseudolycoriella hygida]|uniref:gamma-glutamylcyclotransferase n=1 Tax=Pseudolycoriella hygida TaxID=35572 RepID=A0A9Q0MR96_9DIPT|nr:Gamma-glutamylcyclotransferase [Pseudolycoriella hygida]
MDICCILVITAMTQASEETLNPPSNETFLYFAYGSNLLSKRIHIQNPTAKRKTIGQLKNYRLDFLRASTNWNGCSATIVEDDGSSVWGAIWEINVSNMKDLDRQEGVDVNFYKVLMKSIETPNGEELPCRLYQQVRNPTESVKFEDIPFDRQPSKTYLKCILDGAVESELPSDYIDSLEKIPNNGRDASPTMLKQLGWE